MQQVTPSVKELFFAALEFESSEARSAFLDRHGGDTELRRQVEELLAVDAQGGDFLESPASMPTVTAAHESHLAIEEAGTVIGPYKLLEAVGEGGMGTVYMAEQTEPVRRRVALKLIKPGMDSKQVVARFEAERQALAMMDHPNIAKVHDAGMTPSGRPFFVMELVRGLPITEFCDRDELSIAERLELFVLVCRAVQHAHQKGVIHRDLKPSNVLVTVIDGVGVPKVIDFGVAKATGQALTDKTLFTGFHQFIGTPLYVSPEQAELSGVDVDTRSDIYSLGVLLYELLTGTTPFDSETLKRAAFDEMRRIIREEEFPRPSTRLGMLGEQLSTVSASRRADPRRLGPSMRGELDWVVMKALEKDRGRRYETASDFAADVMRYLTDRPVEAFPPSNRYRFAKFARRNRVAFAAAGFIGAALSLAVVALAVGAVVIFQERAEAVRQRNAAQRERAEAQRQRETARRAVDEMYAQVADKWLGQQPKMTAVQREFLEKALAFFEQFAAEHTDDPKAGLDAARARTQVARTRATLGELDKAGAAYRQAIAQCEDLGRRYPGDPVYYRELIRCLTGLALVHTSLGRLGEAEVLFRRSVATGEELVTQYPDVVEDRCRLAGYLNNLAINCRARGQLQEAEALLRRGQELGEPLVKDLKSANTSARKNLAAVEVSLGGLLNVSKRYQEAEKAYLRSLELEESLLADDPSNPELRRGVAAKITSLGTLYEHMSRFEEACTSHRRAETLLQALAGDYPAHHQIRHDLAATRSNLALALLRQDNNAEAEQAARRGWEVSQGLVRDNPDVPDYRMQLAHIHLVLATIFEKERPDESEGYRDRAYEMLNRLVADFPKVADYRLHLATVCRHYVESPGGRLRAPERDLERARRATVLDPKDQLNWKWLGVAEYATGHWDAAIQAAEKCIEVRGDGGWAFMWLTLALAHERRGDSDKAREWYAKTRPAREEGHWADTPRWMVDEATRLFSERGPVPPARSVRAAVPPGEPK